jgi:hypothetical protein
MRLAEQTQRFYAIGVQKSALADLHSRLLCGVQKGTPGSRDPRLV